MSCSGLLTMNGKTLLSAQRFVCWRRRFSWIESMRRPCIGPERRSKRYWTELNRTTISVASRPRQRAFQRSRFETAWKLLRGAINFRNISSDSLAFVYENTLVTADTRKRFGTHSTPRQLAEYVLGRIDLARFDLDGLTIFEPFTGAGTFLVSALRHVRDLLPQDLSRKERHSFMVSRIRGRKSTALRARSRRSH